MKKVLLHEICESDRNQWSSGIVRLWPALADACPGEVPELGELRECRLDDLAGRSRSLEISYQEILADEPLLGIAL